LSLAQRVMLKIIAIAGGVLAILVVAFIVWRWTSVARGMEEVDKKVIPRLEPVVKRIESGQEVSRQEIDALAVRPENRFMLFSILRHLNRPDLLPTNCISPVSQGESALAFWCMHPNELGDAPDAIELVEAVKRTVGGRELQFQVFRFRMPPDHPEAKEGWLLGVVGPVKNEQEPYSEMPTAMSRSGDVEAKVKPSELVDWYVDLLGQKGMLP